MPYREIAALIVTLIALPALAEEPVLEPVAPEGVAGEIIETITLEKAPFRTVTEPEPVTEIIGEPEEAESPVLEPDFVTESDNADIFIHQTDELEPVAEQIPEKELLEEDKESRPIQSDAIFLRTDNPAPVSDTAAKVTYQRELEAARQAEQQRQAQQQQQQLQAIQNLLNQQGGSVTITNTPPF